MKEISFEDSYTLEMAHTERQHMSNLNHRNICKYYDSFIANGNNLYLVMEYCDWGDLDQYLQRMNSIALTTQGGTGWGDIGETKVWRFFLQICLALEVIHE